MSMYELQEVMDALGKCELLCTIGDFPGAARAYFF